MRETARITRLQHHALRGTNPQLQIHGLLGDTLDELRAPFTAVQVHLRLSRSNAPLGHGSVSHNLLFTPVLDIHVAHVESVLAEFSIPRRVVHLDHELKVGVEDVEAVHDVHCLLFELFECPIPVSVLAGI